MTALGLSCSGIEASITLPTDGAVVTITLVAPLHNLTSCRASAGSSRKPADVTSRPWSPPSVANPPEVPTSRTASLTSAPSSASGSR